MNRAVLSYSNLCWRCQTEQGDIDHVFLNCPKLDTYWQRVMEKIGDSQRVLSVVLLLLFVTDPILATLNGLSKTTTYERLIYKINRHLHRNLQRFSNTDQEGNINSNKSDVRNWNQASSAPCSTGRTGTGSRDDSFTEYFYVHICVCMWMYLLFVSPVLLLSALFINIIFICSCFLFIVL